MHPLRRGRRPLGLGDDHPQHPQGPDEQHDVDVEGHERAEAEAAVEHLVAAVAEHRDQADVGQQLHRRQVGGPHPGRRHRLAVDVVGLVPQPVGLALLGAEPLDHADARHRLLDHRGQLRRFALDGHGRHVEAAREALAHPVEEREAPQRQHRQDGVDEGQDHRHRGDGHHVGDGQRDQHDELLDLLQVGVGPAHELAGLVLVVEREVQPLEVGEQAVPQHELGPPALAERQVTAEAGEGGGDHPGTGDGQGPEQEGLAVLGDDPLVDGGPHQQRGGDLADGPQQAHHDPGGDAPPLRPHRGGDELPPVTTRTRVINGGQHHGSNLPSGPDPHGGVWARRADPALSPSGASRPGSAGPARHTTRRPARTGRG